MGGDLALHDVLWCCLVEQLVVMMEHRIDLLFDRTSGLRYGQLLFAGLFHVYFIAGLK